MRSSCGLIDNSTFDLRRDVTLLLTTSFEVYQYQVATQFCGEEIPYEAKLREAGSEECMVECADSEWCGSVEVCRVAGGEYCHLKNVSKDEY